MTLVKNNEIQVMCGVYCVCLSQEVNIGAILIAIVSYYAEGQLPGN
jgi:phage gp45-like